MNKDNRFIEITDSLFKSRIVAWIVLIYFIIVSLGGFLDNMSKIDGFIYDQVIVRLVHKTLSDSDLESQAKSLALQINKEQQQIKSKEPIFDNQKWDASTQELIKFSQESQRESIDYYLQNFQEKVANLRLEFKKRGLSDKFLDMAYDRPVNSLDIDFIASGLNNLSALLEVGSSTSDTMTSSE